MTFFVFRGATSHEWTCCDPINSWPTEMYGGEMGGPRQDVDMRRTVIDADAFGTR